MGRHMPPGHPLAMPMITILYVNEFSTQLKGMSPYVFADDTKCQHAVKTNDDFIAKQEDLNVACKWSKEYSLIFN